MNKTLILLTSTFPYGLGETFLETELPFLAKEFSQVIIVPTKKCRSSILRSIPNNCQIETSVIHKKNSENRLQRLFSKIWLALNFSFFYKELLLILPFKINIHTINELLTYSRDASLLQNTLLKVISSYKLSAINGIIYSYWCNGTVFGATLVKPPIKVISRVHRGDLYEDLYPKKYIPFRKISISKIDEIFSISENGLNYLKEKYPSNKDKFKLSRLGIPIPILNNTLSSKDIKLNLVSCSNVYSVKRVNIIADILKSYASKNPETSFTWHHFGDGEQFIELKNKIKKLPRNMECVLHGHIENKVLLEWYRCNIVNLFINLSKSEGIPVSIMEANSFGIPAIATDVGGTSELVTNKNGWLIKPYFSEKEINSALDEALKNNSLRIEKGIEARNTCMTYFDSKKNYPAFIKYIKDLIPSTLD